MKNAWLDLKMRGGGDLENFITDTYTANLKIH